MGRILKSKALLVSALLFAIFIVNVIYGKLAVLGGATTTPGLGDVGEFLVLFAAVVLFIAACLRREADAEGENQIKTNEEGVGDVE